MLLGLSAVIALAVLSACGGRGSSNVSQVAARVNDGEITVHQINQVLRTARGVTEANIGQARQQILERLIQQELLVQRAQEQKLDRDPLVLQALEASRRDILARAYLERAAAAAPKPQGNAVRAWFDEHPELFKDRRVFRFNEFRLAGLPNDGGELLKALGAAASLREAVDLVRKAGGDVSVSSNVVRPIEALPATLHARLGDVKEGAMLVYPVGGGLVVSEVRGIAASPVDEKQALPAIERLLEERERQSLLAAEVKRLREVSKIAYFGEFEAAGKQQSGAVTEPLVPGDEAKTEAEAKAGVETGAGSGAEPAPPAGGLSQGIRGLR